MTKAFEIKNVVKIYPDFKLGPLNLELNPGTVLGYIGPNGSGKTTTMHCLVGLVKIDEGKIKIFGQEINPVKFDWRYNIGYVGDDHAYYKNWTAGKNLKFFKAFYPNWSDRLVDKYADRFRLPLNKKVKDLSTGNQVKLSLISALAYSPKLLLLDEPTSGLDPVVRTEVLDTLFEIIEDGERAVLYSTHILSDISRLADELAFLIDGHVVLRQEKEGLIEKWRKITFRHSGHSLSLDSIVTHKQEGKDHQVISKDYVVTLNQIKEGGALILQETRLSIDEIAVHIMKGEMKSQERSDA